MVPTTATAGVFGKAERLEELAAAIYETLATHFPDDRVTAKLFDDLAAEERQHAARVRMLAHQQIQNGKVWANTLELAGIDLLIEEGVLLLASITTTGPLSREEALVLAGRIEEIFAVAHAHLIAAAIDPCVARFFEKLAAQDVAHRELMKPPKPGVR